MKLFQRIKKDYISNIQKKIQNNYFDCLYHQVERL
jgi:hypothetical protein